MLLSVYYIEIYIQLQDITQKTLQLLECCIISVLDSSTQTSPNTEIQRLYTE